MIVIRRLLLVFLAGAAVFLVPWTFYLAKTLPDRYDTGQWRVAWVGFDTALVGCFAAATWLGVRRNRAAVPMLAATAALLFCDAWFDVLLDWSGPDRWTSLAMAIGAELPIAGLLVWRARVLLVGGLRRRTLTMRDIELRTDPDYQRLQRALANLAPVGVAELVEAFGRPVAEVERMLGELRFGGYVRRGRDGRWRPLPMYTELPKPEDQRDEAGRARVVEFVNAKYEHELRLLTWAVSHRDEFGPWGKGHRAVMRLSEAELAAFDAEYNDLLARYSLRRREPATEAGTREVAIRFYAFPTPADPIPTASPA